VARKDNTSQEAPLGLDLHRGKPDPCECQSEAPEETCRVPLVGPRSPTSEVRALARSWDGEDPSTGKGQVQKRVQALPYAPRSGGNPPRPRGLWLVT
jgi:hypothetical protein